MARASAAGEQDALRGYGYQYDHIAAAVYDHYRAGRGFELRPVDPGVGDQLPLGVEDGGLPLIDVALGFLRVEMLVVHGAEYLGGVAGSPDAAGGPSVLSQLPLAVCGYGDGRDWTLCASAGSVRGVAGAQADGGDRVLP
jgi:hypothetical protein